MDAASLHTHTGAYGVDAVVVALHSYLGALARDAGHGADADEALVDLRHLYLEEAAEEVLIRARYGDLGIVVGVVDIGDDGAHGLTLAEEVARDALILGQQQLVFVVVEQQSLARPCLIHLAGHQLPFEVLKLGVDGLFLQVADLGLQCLAQCEDGAAAEVGKDDLLGVLLADLHLGVVVGAGVGERDLQVGILHLAVGHHFEILENLHVALVGVHDHVEILVGTEHIRKHLAERLLKHAYHGGFVDIFQFLKRSELVHQIGGFLFLSHFLCKGIYCFFIFFFGWYHRANRPNRRGSRLLFI